MRYTCSATPGKCPECSTIEEQLLTLPYYHDEHKKLPVVLWRQICCFVLFLVFVSAGRAYTLLSRGILLKLYYSIYQTERKRKRATGHNMRRCFNILG